MMKEQQQQQTLLEHRAELVVIEYLNVIIGLGVEFPIYFYNR